MNTHIEPVDLTKAYRLINHGPKVIPEPHVQNTYDLFIVEIIGAWADTRVCKDGRWNFETADPNLRSIHHIAGGNYYAIGDAVKNT